MTQRILVINPNSTLAVTQGIDRALEPLRLPGGPVFECATLTEGPPGIQTQRDVDGVIGPLTRLIASRDHDCDAFVIACYSDPGLHSAREVTGKPVLGISECGVLTALTVGHRFGVIAILAGSIPRHLRYLGAMGVSDRLAAELPVGLQVTELSDVERTKSRLIDTGRRLVEDHGAHVVVMGCAGMAQYRRALEDAIGVPVSNQPRLRPAWRWPGCGWPAPDPRHPRAGAVSWRPGPGRLAAMPFPIGQPPGGSAQVSGQRSGREVGAQAERRGAFVDHPAHRHEAVNLPLEAQVLNPVARCAQGVGVLSAFVAQRVIACGDDQCGRQLAMVAREQGRGAPISVLGVVTQVV